MAFSDSNLVNLLTPHSHTLSLSRYYDDFHTIDWVRDRNRDRLRHKRLNRDGRLSWRGCTLKMWDAGSGWLIVFLVGVSSGLLAGIHTSLSLSLPPSLSLSVALVWVMWETRNYGSQ